MKKLIILLLCAAAALLFLCACAGEKVISEEEPDRQTENNAQDTEEPEMDRKIGLTIDGRAVSAEWLDNDAVTALGERLAEGDVTVRMEKYGGFEQVGALGFSLPRSDAQTAAAAGDIVLYSGNQIVIFYGSNSWAYTRLGRITGLSGAELTALLGAENVSATLSLE